MPVDVGFALAEQVVDRDVAADVHPPAPPKRLPKALDVDTASLDVIARLHPGGCGADDVDHAVSQASWALRSGGLLLLTLPIGEDDPDWAVAPAAIRGVLARAHDLGLVLVGDVDGDITERIRRASASSRELWGTRPQRADHGATPAYGILRLTFRRR